MSARVRFALVVALFVFLAGDGLFTFFTGDDLMNLYKVFVADPGYVRDGLLRFWSSDYYRPLGGLAYIALYRAFGFDPLPFRVAGFVLLLANLALAWVVLAKLLGSRERGALAVLLVAYNARMDDLYLNFGTVYEMLCFSFYYLAFLAWITARGAGRPLGLRRHVAVLALYLLALSGKEMAVSLPLALLAWELLLAPRSEGRWPRHVLAAGERVVPSALLTMVFLAGKLHGPESLAQLDAYKPVLSLDAYLQAMSHYFNNAFLLDWCTPARAAWALVASLALSLILRDRHALFGWTLFVASLLPVSFITPRSGFVLYVGTIGLGLWLVAVLARALPSRAPLAAAAGVESVPVFLAALAFTACVGLHFKAVFDGGVRRYIDRNAAFHAGFERLGLVVPKGAHILLLDDPYDADVYDPLFLLALAHADPALEVHRAKMPSRELEPLARYDFVLDDREDGWRVLKAPGRLSPELAAVSVRLGHRLPES